MTDPDVTRSLRRRAGLDEAEGREDFSFVDEWRDADGYRHTRQVEIPGRVPAYESGIVTVRAGAPGPEPTDPGGRWPELVDKIVERWLELNGPPFQYQMATKGWPASTIRTVVTGRGKWKGAVAAARQRIQEMPNP